MKFRIYLSNSFSKISSKKPKIQSNWKIFKEKKSFQKGTFSRFSSFKIVAILNRQDVAKLCKKIFLHFQLPKYFSTKWGNHARSLNHLSVQFWCLGEIVSAVSACFGRFSKWDEKIERSDLEAKAKYYRDHNDIIATSSPGRSHV